MGSTAVTQSTRNQRTVTLCRVANRCTMRAPCCQASAKEAPTTCPTRARRRPPEIEKNKMIFFSPASPTGTKSSSTFCDSASRAFISNEVSAISSVKIKLKKTPPYCQAKDGVVNEISPNTSIPQDAVSHAHPSHRQTYPAHPQTELPDRFPLGSGH